jgi:hypothetical protein
MRRFSATRPVAAGGVGGVRGLVEGVVLRPHVHLAAVRQVHQGKVHRAAAVVAALPRHVALLQHPLVVRALRPVHHPQRGAHGAVSIEHLEAQPARPQRLVHARQRPSRLGAHHRERPLVPRQHRAGEVVRRRVAHLRADGAVERLHVHQRPRREVALAAAGRGVHRRGGGRGRGLAGGARRGRGRARAQQKRQRGAERPRAKKIRTHGALRPLPAACPRRSSAPRPGRRP